MISVPFRRGQMTPRRVAQSHRTLFFVFICFWADENDVLAHYFRPIPRGQPTCSALPPEVPLLLPSVPQNRLSGMQCWHGRHGRLRRPHERLRRTAAPRREAFVVLSAERAAVEQMLCTAASVFGAEGMLTSPTLYNQAALAHGLAPPSRP